jgi:Predicted lactoylglutathione lyase
MKVRARLFTFYAGGGERPLEFFCFSEDKNHRPNGTRIAFWADTREEVDQISKLVRDAGGKNLEGPEVCEDYSPGYYAFFFEDPDGNKLEICCREKPVFAVNLVEAAVPAATIAILQTTRLPLHLGSGRFKNEEPGASRTCHFAGARRVRYLKLIALFKIGKGALLLVAGASLLFLNTRLAGWMRCRTGPRMKSCSSTAAPSSGCFTNSKPSSQTVQCGRRVSWRYFMRRFFSPKESAFTCSNAGRSYS